MKLKQLLFVIPVLILGSCTVTQKYHSAGFTIISSHATLKSNPQTQIARMNHELAQKSVVFSRAMNDRPVEITTKQEMLPLVTTMDLSPQKKKKPKFEKLDSQKIQAVDTSQYQFYREKIRRKSKARYAILWMLAVDVLASTILLETSGTDKFLTTNQAIALVLMFPVLPILLIIFVIVDTKLQKYRKKLNLPPQKKSWLKR